MLWTDAGSRDFIAENYPWFLDNFDSYTYPIQRADAIRYFVLHHYGGVYLDLDIGCVKPLDPLLVYPVILPKTIPVGVSNDLMFAEKGHPFLAQTIHNLITFDHSWILNYPTVMFSTGPMFLSAQYGLYTSAHPVTPDHPEGEVRILPKSLYGKNAKEGEAPHSFFTHFYGSSWHADDAAFIGFLGKWGKGLMWVGLVVLVFGLIRMVVSSDKQRKYRLRKIGNYDVILPRWVQRNGRWHLDLGWLSLPGSSTQPSSPEIVHDSAVIEEDENVALLFDDEMEPSSPTISEVSSGTEVFGRARANPSLVQQVRRAGRRAFAAVFGGERRPTNRHRRQRPSQGVMFFLPAYFNAQSADIEQPPVRPELTRAASTSSAAQVSHDKGDFTIERDGTLGDRIGWDHPHTARSRSQQSSRTATPAPPTDV